MKNVIQEDAIMATLVGKESALVDLLNDLIQLDFDAIEAYEAALSRLDDTASKEQLRQFMGDHERHTRELGALVWELGGHPAQKADIKSLLTKGKVVISNLAGDSGILQAMKTNEDDTNTAYERAAAREDVPPRIREVFQRNLVDERRHRTWIEARLAQM
jgi:uncharacterized protein (TIGR02284 family)